MEEGVTSISNYSFSGCENLDSMVIPKGVTVIEEGTFHNCGCLKSVTLPNTIKEIGYKAFYYCTILQEITIPEKVLHIRDLAFAENKHLTSIYCKPTIPPMTYSQIIHNSPNATIYVPRGTKHHYKATGGWCDIINRIEEFDY